MNALRRAVLLGLGTLVLQTFPASAQVGLSDAGMPLSLSRATEPLSFAAWVRSSGDAAGRPFVIVDKLSARVLAFDGAGTLIGDTPALLGTARGDESPAGIGSMRLSEITPPMRITPAGRFDAHLGLNLAGQLILWVDYESALSLHAVVTGNSRERRLERLATQSVLDNRISYGCINVPVQFYNDIIKPLFEPANGVVYILPEDTLPSGRANLGALPENAR